MPHFVAFSIEISAPHHYPPDVLETQKTSQKLNFRMWLQKEFTDRCRRNPSFSLRAFAKLIGMEASSVSQLMAGKRNASHKVIGKICDRLSVPPEIRHQFLASSNRPQSKSDSVPDYRQIAADAFAVIADWYHYAILELTHTENFNSSPKWIADKLGISIIQASVAIERLERLELIEIKEGRLCETGAFLTNYSEGFTAPALKELQRQVLQKALNAIDYVPQEEKDITSMTMAIDVTKLPEAKKRIKNFRRELCTFLEGGPRARVYNLGVQLYPISKSTVFEEKKNE